MNQVQQKRLLTVDIAREIPDMGGWITIWKDIAAGEVSYYMMIQDEYAGSAPPEIQNDQQAVLFWLGKIREMLQMFAS